MNYYNEFDPHAAAWLRELVKQGTLPAGDVDQRSIEDVSADELKPYTQCHFFAGIGGWPLALRLAGWSADRPVWTGSCPCQPFSAAGRRKGFEDGRHLWPVWYRLIREYRPVAVFGEQVANKDALPWLDLVQTDLEASGYAFGAADLCAAGIGAPHIRQRLYWGAYAVGSATGRLAVGKGSGWRKEPERLCQRDQRDCPQGEHRLGRDVATCQLADCNCKQNDTADTQRFHAEPCSGRVAGRLADDAGNRCRRQRQRGTAQEGRQPQSVTHGVLPDGSEGRSVAGRMDDSQLTGLEGRARSTDAISESGRQQTDTVGSVTEAGIPGGLADADGRNACAERQQCCGKQRQQPEHGRCGVVAPEQLSHSECQQHQRCIQECGKESGTHNCGSTSEPAGRCTVIPSPAPVNGQWRNADWLLCRDGKWRPVESGTFPLAHGIPARVVRLRGYGNAIVPALAAEFICAFDETLNRTE